MKAFLSLFFFFKNLFNTPPSLGPIKESLHGAGGAQKLRMRGAVNSTPKSDNVDSFHLNTQTVV